MQLPCGQCIGCRLERSRQWAVRIMHEASMHEVSSFVTLTYDDKHLPDHGSLRYRDFQLFMKRLRKKLGKGKVRFFMCGEYGEEKRRPHYHVCLFGAAFLGDRYLWRRTPAGFDLYRSPFLETVWTSGGCEIGDLTFESAAYVARYCVKKVTGAAAEAHYSVVDPATGEIAQLVPEFARMSRGGRTAAGGGGGIGSSWFDEFKDDVYGGDEASVVVRGVRCKPPRAYERRLPELLLKPIRDKRLDDSRSRGFDSSVSRLRVRETVTRARLAFKRKTLE